jgi:outer membrane protein, adhesin transport system
MKIRFIYFVLILFSCFKLTEAQVVYTLNDCIGTGLERNFSIRIARNNKTISSNNYTPGNAGFLPTLDLSSRYNGTLNNTTQNLSDGSQSVSKGVNNTTASASLGLAWTLFSGFNVITTYKKLNELKQLGELNSQLAIEDYVTNLISVYYLVIQQIQQVNNLKYAMTLSRERLRIDEERYMLGSSSKLQVLQSRVYVNADSAKLSKQVESLRATQIKLNELMAVEDMGVQFIVKDTSVEVKPDLLYEKLLEETYASNTSLLIAAKNKVISEYDYKLVVSRVYPYLNFSTGYGFTLNTYSTGTTKNQQTNGMNYGLTMGFNIFDGFNKKREILNSSIDIKTKELKFSEIEQGVIADLLTIYNGYSNNLRLVKLEEQNLETATENLAIAMERYKLGSLSGIDLREVQKSLLDAKESLLTVQYQAKIAEISLLVISGRIMEYYR